MSSFNQRAFRFGVIAEQMSTATAWHDRARRVETLGYSTLLIRDHFIPEGFGHQFAPFSALATAAAVTTRLRVGTMVLGNDYRHPVLLAKEAATLDQLSAGRFELGIDAGWMRNEYLQAGMRYDPPGVRIGRLAEAIRVIKGLCAGAPLHFTGEHYRIAGLESYSPPVQRPHPPLLIGGSKRRVLELAGREADSVGILTSSVAGGSVGQCWRRSRWGGGLLLVGVGRPPPKTPPHTTHSGRRRLAGTVTCR
jgi:probable F420-dependent oxidoreductase